MAHPWTDNILIIPSFYTTIWPELCPIILPLYFSLPPILWQSPLFLPLPLTLNLPLSFASLPFCINLPPIFSSPLLWQSPCHQYSHSFLPHHPLPWSPLAGGGLWYLSGGVILKPPFTKPKASAATSRPGHGGVWKLLLDSLAALQKEGAFSVHVQRAIFYFEGNLTTLMYFKASIFSGFCKKIHLVSLWFQSAYSDNHRWGTHFAIR